MPRLHCFWLHCLRICRFVHLALLPFCTTACKLRESHLVTNLVISLSLKQAAICFSQLATLQLWVMMVVVHIAMHLYYGRCITHACVSNLIPRDIVAFCTMIFTLHEFYLVILATLFSGFGLAVIAAFYI